MTPKKVKKLLDKVEKEHPKIFELIKSKGENNIELAKIFLKQEGGDIDVITLDEITNYFWNREFNRQIALFSKDLLDQLDKRAIEKLDKPTTIKPCFNCNSTPCKKDCELRDITT